MVGPSQKPEQPDTLVVLRDGAVQQVVVVCPANGPVFDTVPNAEVSAPPPNGRWEHDGSFVASADGPLSARAQVTVDPPTRRVRGVKVNNSGSGYRGCGGQYEVLRQGQKATIPVTCQEGNYRLQFC